MTTKPSEFGKGLTYCLGLFLAHAERYNELNEYKSESNFACFMFFNGASDHLYEMQIPEDFPATLQNRLKIFQGRCIQFGHGMDITKSKEEDVMEAIGEAKSLLLEIDKFFGIDTKKARWD